MKVTRIYADNKGETHFEDMDIKLENVFENRAIKISKPLKASGMSFTSFSGVLDEDWHTAPRKQAIIILAGGEVEVAVSDGTMRRFAPGHVLMMEDTTGKGHTTRSVNDAMREEIWVALD
jgi:hypothetical protein